MVVNFRTRKINQGIYKLVRAFMLINKKKVLNVYCRIILTSSCLIEVAVSPGCLEHAYYPKSEYCFTKLKNIFNTLTPPVCLS
jgi:hypothetical protein